MPEEPSAKIVFGAELDKDAQQQVLRESEKLLKQFSEQAKRIVDESENVEKLIEKHAKYAAAIQEVIDAKKALYEQEKEESELAAKREEETRKQEEAARRQKELARQQAEAQRQAAREAALMAAAWNQIFYRVTEAAIGATRRLMDFSMASVETAAKTEQMVFAAYHLGHNVGKTTTEIQGTIDAIRALGISTQSAAAAVANMVRFEMDLSKATDLVRSALYLSVETGRDVSDTLERLIHGITTLQTRTLRYIGLHINLNEVMRETAKSLGKNVDALTEQERIMGLTNAVIAQTNRMHSLWTTNLKTAAGQAMLFKVDIQELQNAIGKPLLGAYRDIIMAGRNLVSSLREQAQPGRELHDALLKIGNATRDLIVNLAELSSTAIPNVISGLARFVDLLTELTDKAQKVNVAIYAGIGTLLLLPGAINKVAASIRILGSAIKFLVGNPIILGLAILTTAVVGAARAHQEAMEKARAEAEAYRDELIKTAHTAKIWSEVQAKMVGVPTIGAQRPMTYPLTKTVAYQEMMRQKLEANQLAYRVFLLNTSRYVNIAEEGMKRFDERIRDIAGDFQTAATPAVEQFKNTLEWTDKEVKSFSNTLLSYLRNRLNQIRDYQTSLRDLQFRYLLESKEREADYWATRQDYIKEGNQEAIEDLDRNYRRQEELQRRQYQIDLYLLKRRNYEMQLEQRRAFGEQLQEMAWQQMRAAGISENIQRMVLDTIGKFTGASLTEVLLLTGKVEDKLNELANATVTDAQKIVAAINAMFSAAIKPLAEPKPPELPPLPPITGISSWAPGGGGGRTETERATQTLASVMEEISNGVRAAIEALSNVLLYRREDFEPQFRALVDDIVTCVRIVHDAVAMMGLDIPKAAGEFSQNATTVMETVGRAMELFSKLSAWKPEVSDAQQGLKILHDFIIDAINHMMWAGWAFGDANRNWRDIPIAAAQFAAMAGVVIDFLGKAIELFDKAADLMPFGTLRVGYVFRKLAQLFDEINMYYQTLGQKELQSPVLEAAVRRWLADMTQTVSELSTFLEQVSNIWEALSTHIPHPVERMDYVFTALVELFDWLKTWYDFYVDVPKEFQTLMPLPENVMDWLASLKPSIDILAAILENTRSIFDAVEKPIVYKYGRVQTIFERFINIFDEINNAFAYFQERHFSLPSEDIMDWVADLNVVANLLDEFIGNVSNIFEALAQDVPNVTGKMQLFIERFVAMLDELRETRAELWRRQNYYATYPEMLYELSSWIEEMNSAAEPLSTLLGNIRNIFEVLGNRIPFARTSVRKMLLRLVDILETTRQTQALINWQKYGYGTAEGLRETMGATKDWLATMVEIIDPLSRLAELFSTLTNALSTYTPANKEIFSSFLTNIIDLLNWAKEILPQPTEYIEYVDALAQWATLVGELSNGLNSTFELLSNLAGYKPIYGAISVASRFVYDLRQVLIAIRSEAEKWDEESLGAMDLFGEGISTTITTLNTAVEMLTNLTKYPGQPQISKFIRDLFNMLNRLRVEMITWSEENIGVAKQWGESVGAMVDGVSKAFELMKGIAQYRPITSRVIDEFTADLHKLITKWIDLAKSFEVDRIDETFLRRLQELIRTLSDALALLRDIAAMDFAGVSSNISRLFEQVRMLLSEMPHLPTQPAALGSGMQGGGLALMPGYYQLAEKGPELILPANITGALLANRAVQPVSIVVNINNPTVDNPSRVRELGVEVREQLHRAIRDLDIQFGQRIQNRSRVGI